MTDIQLLFGLFFPLLLVAVLSYIFLSDRIRRSERRLDKLQDEVVSLSHRVETMRRELSAMQVHVYKALEAATEPVSVADMTFVTESLTNIMRDLSDTTLDELEETSAP